MADALDVLTRRNEALARKMSCTIELNDELAKAEISININPNFRGKGYGPQCLVYAASYVAGACPTCGVIEAVVRAENHASIRAFSSAGYREVARKGGLIHFVLDVMGK